MEQNKDKRFSKKGNEYIDKEDHYEIVINSVKHGRMVTRIDKDDYEKCKKYTWGVYFRYNYYCSTHLNKKKGRNPDTPASIQLHRYIMDTPKHLCVDHINHDTLDNRKQNLRNTDSSGNAANRKGAYCTNKLGVRNVGWDPGSKKYKVIVNKVVIGYYKTIEEADQVARAERIRLWGKS